MLTAPACRSASGKLSWPRNIAQFPFAQGFRVPTRATPVEGPANSRGARRPSKPAGASVETRAVEIFFPFFFGPRIPSAVVVPERTRGQLRIDSQPRRAGRTSQSRTKSFGFSLRAAADSATWPVLWCYGRARGSSLRLHHAGPSRTERGAGGSPHLP